MKRVEPRIARWVVILQALLILIMASQAGIVNDHREAYSFEGASSAAMQSKWNGPNSNSTLWEYETLGATLSSPAVGAGGSIYFGSSSGYLYALNDQGELRWKFYAGGSVSTPAVGSNGELYFFSGNGSFYAVNTSGFKTWSIVLFKGPDYAFAYSSPEITSEGSILLPFAIRGQSGGQFLDLFSQTGALMWSFRSQENVGAIPIPTLGANGTIYVSGYRMIYSLSPSGNINWSRNVSLNIGYNATLAPQGVVYSAFGGPVTEVSPSNVTLWSFDAVDRLGLLYCCTAMVVGQEGTVYGVGLNGGGVNAPTNAPDAPAIVFALNRNGSLLWYDGISNTAKSILTGSSGVIYLVGNSVTALSADNGSEIWNYDIAGTSTIRPAPGPNDTLVVTSSLGGDGFVFDLGGPTGSRLYTVSFIQTGMPAGYIWSVILDGVTKTSSGSNIFFSEPNGTYVFHIEAVGLVSNETDGTCVVNGAGATIPITLSLELITTNANGLNKLKSFIPFLVIAGYLAILGVVTVKWSSSKVATGDPIKLRRDSLHISSNLT